MAELTPVDPNRCQVEITQGSAFQIGNPRRTERCSRTPYVVLREKSPGEDGHFGAMSVCRDCIQSLPTPMKEAVLYFPPTGVGALPPDLRGKVHRDDLDTLLSRIADTLCEDGFIAHEGGSFYWGGTDEDFARRMGLISDTGPETLDFIWLKGYFPIQTDPWIWNSVCRVWFSLWYEGGSRLRGDAHISTDHDALIVECQNPSAICAALKLPEGRVKVIHECLEIEMSDLKLSDRVCS